MRATMHLNREEVEKILLRALEDNFRVPLEITEISVVNYYADERFLSIEFQKREGIEPPALLAHKSATEATHQETSPHPTSSRSEDDPIPF